MYLAGLRVPPYFWTHVNTSIFSMASFRSAHPIAMAAESPLGCDQFTQTHHERQFGLGTGVVPPRCSKVRAMGDDRGCTPLLVLWEARLVDSSWHWPIIVIVLVIRAYNCFLFLLMTAHHWTIHAYMMIAMFFINHNMIAIFYQSIIVDNSDKLVYFTPRLALLRQL